MNPLCISPDSCNIYWANRAGVTGFSGIILCNSIYIYIILYYIMILMDFKVWQHCSSHERNEHM